MGTFSIITGSGFTGNAQHNNYGPGSDDNFFFQIISYTGATDPNTYDWVITFKYRSSDGMSLGLNVDSYWKVGPVPFVSNTGNAITSGCTFSSGAGRWSNISGDVWSTRLKIGFLVTVQQGDYNEIDEVNMIFE